MGCHRRGATLIHIKIIAVGKLKEKYWSAAIEEYTKRLAAYALFEIVEVPECRLYDKPTTADISRCLSKEANAILKHVKEGDTLILLDIEGKPYTSEGLAKTIQEWMNQGRSSLCFVIGSSHGLADELKGAAHERISFSNMTFPHQLARVIWCEQLYRAFKIINNEPYHK